MVRTETEDGGVRSYTLVGRDGRPYRSDVPGELGGHRGSRIYGRLDCPSALRARARGGYTRSRVFFADEATAIAAGYRPCGVCQPEKYALWKAGQRSRSQRGAASPSTVRSVDP